MTKNRKEWGVLKRGIWSGLCTCTGSSSSLPWPINQRRRNEVQIVRLPSYWGQKHPVVSPLWMAEEENAHPSTWSLQCPLAVHWLEADHIPRFKTTPPTLKPIPHHTFLPVLHLGETKVLRAYHLLGNAKDEQASMTLPFPVLGKSLTQSRSRSQVTEKYNTERAIIWLLWLRVDPN